MQLLWSGACPYCQTDYSYFLAIPAYQRVLHCFVLLLCLAMQWVGLSLANLDCALEGETVMLTPGLMLYAWGWVGATPGMLVTAQHLEFRWRNR